MSARSRSRTVSMSPRFRRTLERSTDLSGTPQSVLRAFRKAQLRDASENRAHRPAPWVMRSQPHHEAERPENTRAQTVEETPEAGPESRERPRMIPMRRSHPCPLQKGLDTMGRETGSKHWGYVSVRIESNVSSKQTKRYSVVLYIALLHTIIVIILIGGRGSYEVKGAEKGIHVVRFCCI